MLRISPVLALSLFIVPATAANYYHYGSADRGLPGVYSGSNSQGGARADNSSAFVAIRDKYRVTKVTTDSVGNSYAAGARQFADGSTDVLVAKLDRTGNTLLVITISAEGREFTTATMAATDLGGISMWVDPPILQGSRFSVLSKRRFIPVATLDSSRNSAQMAISLFIPLTLGGQQETAASVPLSRTMQAMHILADGPNLGITRELQGCLSGRSTPDFPPLMEVSSPSSHRKVIRSYTPAFFLAHATVTTASIAITSRASLL